jgi:DNA-directed RNA polymerase subunit H (RpoH/RPB5)
MISESFNSSTSASSPDWEQIPVENHHKIWFETDNILVSHKLFCKHEKISRKEFGKTGLDYNKLPCIYTYDLGTRYCKAIVGDIIKIYRKNGKIYYRRVIAEK